MRKNKEKLEELQKIEFKFSSKETFSLFIKVINEKNVIVKIEVFIDNVLHIYVDCQIDEILKSYTSTYKEITDTMNDKEIISLCDLNGTTNSFEQIFIEQLDEKISAYVWRYIIVTELLKVKNTQLNRDTDIINYKIKVKEASCNFTGMSMIEVTYKNDSSEAEYTAHINIYRNYLFYPFDIFIEKIDEYFRNELTEDIDVMMETLKCDKSNIINKYNVLK